MAENLYIIGGGQMGTSIARTALEKNAGGNITIFEPHAANRQELEDYLTELGISDQITVTAQHDEELANADIVIMATPIDHFHAVTAEVAPLMKEGAILTDIGSAKVKSVEDQRQCLNWCAHRARHRRHRDALRYRQCDLHLPCRGLFVFLLRI